MDAMGFLLKSLGVTPEQIQDMLKVAQTVATMMQENNTALHRIELQNAALLAQNNAILALLQARELGANGAIIEVERIEN